MIIESFSAEQTFELGKKVGNKATIGNIYCLKGDLGVGKTVFTKGMAEGLDIHEHITSPTFNIVNIYEGRMPFYHFDVYRIVDVDEMYEIGFEEMFFGEGVCLIEWAELIKEIIPKQAIWITIEKDLTKGYDYRKINIEGEIL
jgi:tRNA threonylcarbamoyladenosine biosynthesis protein TsaE